LQLLGVKVDDVSIDEALKKIEGFLADGRQHYIVTINPEFIVRAQKDDEFRQILNEADLAVPDGIGVVWASRFIGDGLKERVAGIDLVVRIKNQESRIKNKKVFLFGGRNDVAEKIAGEWPEVVGFSENPDEATALINKYGPDVLLVALGAPKQEKWIAENLKKLLSVKVAIGVGGAFDLISGRLKRAPKFIQKMGLEWLWRLGQEPKRIGRIFNAAAVFPLLILEEKFFKKNIKILVFLHGTAIMHKNAAGFNREERVRQVKDREPSVFEYESYIPVGNVVQKLRNWERQGGEILYLSSHETDRDVAKDGAVLEKYGFPKGRVFYRHSGEQYKDVAERILPDVLIEDDCESIGGEKEMAYPHVRQELKKKIKSIIVKEFEGIDDLQDDVGALKQE